MTDPAVVLRFVRSLTPREGQVLEAVGNGATYREAGVRLGIAPATVKAHLQNILRRMPDAIPPGAARHRIVVLWVRWQQQVARETLPERPPPSV